MREQASSIMNNKEHASNELFAQTNSCCTDFLENQIRVLQAVKRALEEFDKEEVIKQIDQILSYYRGKLDTLPRTQQVKAMV